MTDQEWSEEFTRALALRGSDPDAAAARLRALSRRAARSGRRAVGVWHIVQCLGTAATILSDTGRHREAAALFRQAARHHQGLLRQHGFGLGSALASAALELFRAGQPTPAARLAWEALRLFGQYPDPSGIHEEVLRHLRAHLNQAARRRRPGSGG